MLQAPLMGPRGTNFIREAKAAERPIFVWTVNKANMMKWNIRKEMDGVITDDPKKFLEICEEWDAEGVDTGHVGLRDWMTIVFFWIMAALFDRRFSNKHKGEIDRSLKRSGAKGLAPYLS